MLSTDERRINDAYHGLEDATSTPFKVRKTFRPDGSVLLSVSQDKMFRLNAVGTMAWEVLSESRDGLTARELAREMGIIFADLNREGRHRIDVSPERLLTDMEKLLESSVAKGILKVEHVPDGERQFAVVDGLCQNAVDVATDLSNGDTVPESDRPRSSADSSAVETLTAMIALAACDVVLKIEGFARMFQMIENWKARPRRAVDESIIKRICGAVDRAQVYYPKKAMCLQRSVVATILLRRQGVDAEMVVAAKDFPLAAHAWVEVDGRVVNDDQEVKTQYSVMTRL